MATEIRPIEDNELPAWMAAMRVGFHQPDPEDEERERRERQFRAELDPARTHGAFDDGRVVATFRSYPTQLTVPGGFVLADAVTNVTVAPSHRRRGLLSTLIHSDLAAAAERGEAVAILVASEWPIYGRYGFGPAAEIVQYELDARAAAFATPGAGEVALVEPGELRPLAPAIYETHRAATPGAIERSDVWWERRLEPAPAKRCALARDEDGRPAGLLVYEVEGHWEDWRPRGKLTVTELFAADPQVEARLWRFAAEVDLIATVIAEQRAVDERLPWLLRDARALRQRYRSDFQWVRVLDAPAALSGRAYATEDTLVLEVDDPLGHAAGRFALQAGRCERTDAPADVALRVEALGAAYLGGASWGTLAAAGWVQERTPGAVARADAMFGWVVRPWCATLF